MSRCPFNHSHAPQVTGNLVTGYLVNGNLASPKSPQKDDLTDPATVIRNLDRYVPTWRTSFKQTVSEATKSKRGFTDFLAPLQQALDAKDPSMQVDQAAVLQIAENCTSQREFMFNMVHLCGKNVVMHLVELYEREPDTNKDIKDVISPFIRAGSQSKEGEKFRKFLNFFDPRIANIRPHIGRSGSSDLERKVILFQNIIDGGILVTAAFTWRFILVASELLSKDGGAEAITSRLPEVLKSVPLMIMALQSSHDDIFHQVDLHLRRRPFETDHHVNFKKSNAISDFDRFYWTLYHPNDFQIIDNKLCFKPETAITLENKVQQAFKRGLLDLTEPTVGCAGAILIPAYCKAAVALCSQRLIDYLPTLLKLPNDGPTYQLHDSTSEPKELALPPDRDISSLLKWSINRPGYKPHDRKHKPKELVLPQNV